MQQNLIYLADSYCKQCAAKVLALLSENQVVLDNNIFYPQGGGQPFDIGTIVKVSDGKKFAVMSVKKVDGLVVVEVDNAGLAPGDEVECKLNWERRYMLMRMHTAAHILASVFYRNTGAQITGNQIDIDRSRFDFSIPQFDRAMMERCVQQANAEIAKGLDVRIYDLPREEAMKIEGVVKLAGALPPSITTLRIVDIGGIDVQADGGTHVKNTREIGTVEVVKLENKGAVNKRLYFALK